MTSVLRPAVPAAAFVRDRVAPHAEAWERERTAPLAEARALGRAGLLPAPDDAAGRLELAGTLGRAGSLGAAATLLHAAGAPLLLLHRHAGPALREQVLAPALAGETIGCVAWPGGSEVEARRGGADGTRLDGTLRAVLNVPGAEWMLVPVAGGLAVVRPADAGVLVEGRRAVGLRAAALGEVRLDGCVVDPARVFAVGAAELDAALAEERLLLATAVVAAAERVLRGTLAFAGTRSFGPGQVLGGQQAVRHRLADLMADLEIAAAFGREGAGALLRGALAPSRAAALMLVAVDAGRRIAEGCMQLMGARGFMADHPAATLYRDLLSVDLLAAGDPGALERGAAEGLRAPVLPASTIGRPAFAHPAGDLA